MRSTFHSSLWQLAIPRPWRAQEFEECVEITQPEGIGALHISGAVKQDGTVSDSETRAQLERDCPEGTDIEPARFGDFIGFGGEYVDWNASAFWKRWFVASGRVLLFVTYNCKRGDEHLELPQVCQILSSLQLRR
jgi:hypothetical protein